MVPIPLRRLFVALSSRNWDLPFLISLLLFEIILCSLIVRHVPYTEIDWIAYNEEVDAWWRDGERDYANIRGGTGPLVYPAGFLYLYRAIQYAAGGDGSDVPAAQRIFVGLYVVHAAAVLSLFTVAARNRVEDARRGVVKRNEDGGATDDSRAAGVVWSWRSAMVLCCLSKRVHSIFVLRLFNDAPAMLLFYVSAVLFSRSRWRTGCVAFSLAVSVKMNVLLFAPGLLLLLLQATDDLYETAACLFICAFVQLVLGAPFLLTFPVSYLRKAFEFDRVFFFKWTVNWKFLPEDVFVSKTTSVILLVLHLTYLVGFAWKWLRACKSQTGRYFFLLLDDGGSSSSSSSKRRLSPEYVVLTLFVSNYVGVCFARTLHYQFYAWYFHTIPFLLWSACESMPVALRVVVFLAVEYSFNVYPATPSSSVVLQLAHLTLLRYLCVSKVPEIRVAAK